MEMLGLGANLVEADLARKSRQDEILWHEEDMKYFDQQRSWQEAHVKQRREDLAWRREEQFQRDLATRMREVDEKNETLKNTGNVAALLAGFTMSALVQISPEENSSSALISAYTTISAIVVCLMTFCFITCTLILVGTLKKFEIHLEESPLENAHVRYCANNNSEEDNMAAATRQAQRKARFQLYWETTCEQDFQRAYFAFSLGVPLFLVNTILATWVKFNMVWPGVLVSVICGVSILLMFCMLQMKWGVYLSKHT